MDAWQQSDVSAWEVPTTVFNLKCYNRILTDLLDLFWPSFHPRASHYSCYQPSCHSCNLWSSSILCQFPPRLTLSHLHPSRMPITHLPTPDKASQSLLAACSISQSVSLLWFCPPHSLLCGGCTSASCFSFLTCFPAYVCILDLLQFGLVSAP